MNFDNEISAQASSEAQESDLPLTEARSARPLAFGSFPPIVIYLGPTDVPPYNLRPFTETQGPGTIANAVPFSLVSNPIRTTDPEQLGAFLDISIATDLPFLSGEGVVIDGQFIGLSSSFPSFPLPQGSITFANTEFTYRVYDFGGLRHLQFAVDTTNGASNALISTYSDLLARLLYTNTSDLVSNVDRKFTFKLTDVDLQVSNSPEIYVRVSGTNDIPTFTNAGAPKAATEETATFFSFADLMAVANEADLDGTVISFVLTGLSSGTLYLIDGQGIWGDRIVRASDFTPTNGVELAIDSRYTAKWTPDKDVTGLQNAFSVVAQDNQFAKSATPITIQAMVAPVNDAPELTTFSWASIKQGRLTELTFASLLEKSNATDIEGNGTVVGFKVTAAVGELRIGADAATATAWAVGSNDIIDATHHAYWMTLASGGISAFEVRAVDDGGLLSGPAWVKYWIESNPYLTAMAGPVVATQEDALEMVTWVSLMVQGDESNVQVSPDGVVDASEPVTSFVVTSVTSGTLWIRDVVKKVPAPFVAGSNDIIDLNHSAYWTPPADLNGVLDAFTVLARDAEGDVSLTAPVQVQIEVTPVNDKPTLSDMAAPLAVISEDSYAQITLAALMGKGDPFDIDGDFVDFVVKSVFSGTLLIGDVNGISAEPWAPGTNDTIDATHKAFWGSPANANGTLNAFTVVARDNEGAMSATQELVQVVVEPVNDIPTLSAMTKDPLATLAPGSQFVVTAELLRSQSNAFDVEGAVPSFAVAGVFSGSLLIRNSEGTMAPWSFQNSIIDASHPAWWTSSPVTLGNVSGFVINAVDSAGAYSETAAVPVNFFIEQPNRAPTLTAMAGPVAAVATGIEVDVPFSTLIAIGNEADQDGTVTSFIVTAVTSGVLKLGTTQQTALEWNPGSNDTIGDIFNSDVNYNAYWTSAAGASGNVNAFKVVAKDDDGASSLPPVQVQVTVTLPDSDPTLTAMAAPVVAVDEDTLAFISLANLKAQGDEADLNGTVDAFVVKSVTSGTLLIRDSVGNAVAWAPGTNDTIDATHGAYWKAGANASGVFDAFTVLAKDNDGNLSLTPPVQVQVTVRPINDKPVMSAMSGPVATSNEDAPAVITLAGLRDKANEADAEGPINAFVITAINSGTMRLGEDGTTAAPWALGTNNTVTATINAYWTPVANANGTINAFSVVAKDDEGLVSTSIQAQVAVTPVNDAPTLTAFSAAVDAAVPGSQIQITMAELASKGNEADIDGTLSKFVVRSVTSGTLLIGSNSVAATAWTSGTNDVIDASHHAFWTPGALSTGMVNAFAVVARDPAGAESAAPVLVPVTVSAAGGTTGGTSAADFLSGGSANDTIRGLAGNDTLLGLTGNDLLDGGLGIDSLNGGDGSDIYFLLGSEHTAAEVFDNGASGIDEVRFAATTASTLLLFAGDTGIERVVIGTGLGATAERGGTVAAGANASALGNAVSMLGNAGANPLTGSRFNDTIDGGPGADIMNGGNGDDTFYVDNTGDRALDSSSTGGIDTVIASVSFTIAANVENLMLVGGALSGVGTGAANTIIGNASANTLSGMAGNDTLNGADGSDLLLGGGGNDWLTGGPGADRFQFDTYPNALTNKDTVADFSRGTDILQFKASVFTTLGLAGQLIEAKFWAGAGVVNGHDATDRLLYDTTTGTLYYDSDGSGLVAAIPVAVIGVDQHPLLTHADIYII